MSPAVAETAVAMMLNGKVFFSALRVGKLNFLAVGDVDLLLRRLGYVSHVYLPPCSVVHLHMVAVYSAQEACC